MFLNCSSHHVCHGIHRCLAALAREDLSEGPGPVRCITGRRDDPDARDAIPVVRDGEMVLGPLFAVVFLKAFIMLCWSRRINSSPFMNGKTGFYGGSLIAADWRGTRLHHRQFAKALFYCPTIHRMAAIHLPTLGKMKPVRCVLIAPGELVFLNSFICVSYSLKNS